VKKDRMERARGFRCRIPGTRFSVLFCGRGECLSGSPSEKKVADF
jgi:hypothetical protein